MKWLLQEWSLQERKYPGYLPDDEVCLAILVEAVGQVALASLEGDKDQMLTELRQVAAFAVRWAEERA